MGGNRSALRLAQYATPRVTKSSRLPGPARNGSHISQSHMPSTQAELRQSATFRRSEDRSLARVRRQGAEKVSPVSRDAVVGRPALLLAKGNAKQEIPGKRLHNGRRS